MTRQLNDPYSRRLLLPAASRERPIFVFGTGERCGSTLLQRLLNTHPDVLIWGEQHGALVHLQRFHEEAMAHEQRHKGTAQVYSESLDRAFIANLSPGAAALQNALRRFFVAFFGGYAVRWGCKEIRWDMPLVVTMACLFPEARFVFVTRHVSGVLRSLYAWGYGIEECREYLGRWSVLAQQLIALPEVLRPCSVVLRYEEFVAQGALAARELADFLDLDQDGVDQAALELRVADHRTIEVVGTQRMRALSAPRELEGLASPDDVQRLLSGLGYPEEAVT